MKKLIALILLIIFSFFFLINPGQIMGAACKEKCTGSGDCWTPGTPIEEIACPLCWPPNYDPSKMNSGTICAQAGSTCTCVGTPATPVVNNTDMCDHSCTTDSGCANDVSGCTVCWPTSVGLMAGDCYSGGCSCITEAAKSKSQSDIQKEKVTTTTENPINLNPQTDLAIKITSIIKYAIGIGGLIAFILIVAGGFQIILSAGSPERVKAGKEMITSAIAGLLLIIFSIFILKLIGYDILNLPGFLVI